MIIDSSSSIRGNHAGNCRFCNEKLHPFVDLGVSPLCESFLSEEALDSGETFFPLDVKICPRCWLAQLREYVPPEEIFSDYAYFSSFSEAWLKHARDFAEKTISTLDLDRDSFVLEVASNDGYLLRNFVESGIPCLGIEPAANVASTAQALGIPTQVAFFGRELAGSLAARGRLADLIVANNVLAQVPDLNDFVAGLGIALKPNGVLSLEFPHLLRLIEENQFDTIYHEHYSYFSLGTIERILAAHAMRVFDVEELWTHGGSLRVFACLDSAAWRPANAVQKVRRDELNADLQSLERYRAFGQQVVETKWKLLDLLIAIKAQGARIVGYGAPGKGNTLLNYCGIRTDFLDFTVDRNPYKHGRYLPGTRIPILSPDALDAARPDYVLILPWNLKEEVMHQLAHIRDWGARFIVPIPSPVVVP